MRQRCRALCQHVGYAGSGAAGLQQLQPQHIILVVKAGAEAAIRQSVPAQQHCGAAKYVAPQHGIQIRRFLYQKVRIARSAGCIHHGVGAVDNVCPGRFGFFQLASQLVRPPHIIGVQKSDIFSGAPIQRQISAGGGAAVDFIVNRVDARVLTRKLRQQLRRPVLRAVIHHLQLPVFHRLLLQRANGVLNIVPSIISGHHHRHQRCSLCRCVVHSLYLSPCSLISCAGKCLHTI